MSHRGTKLLVWGSDSCGQLGLNKGPCHMTPQLSHLPFALSAIACGESHVLLLNDIGEVYTQGSNHNGELGVDDRSLDSSRDPLKVNLVERAVKVFCGLSYSFALLSNGDVYGWGLNQQGILGPTHVNASWKPTKLHIDREFRVRTISCGALHCGFLTEGGEVLMCGSNEYGELGLLKREKVAVPTLLDLGFQAVDIACGVFYTLLLDNHGRVYAFGNNKYGQLGNGTKQSECYAKRIKALQNEYVVKVSAGYHSGALTNRGELFIWGSGTFGEYLLPHRIEIPSGGFFMDFAIGGFFGAAVDRYGKVYTWGNNANGELGQGSTKSLKCPTEIPEIKNVDRLYCGQNFVFAVPKCHFVTPSLTPSATQSLTPSYALTPSFTPNKENTKQPKEYKSIEKAVCNFKKTVNELQSKQKRLCGEKSQLEERLFTLSQDYEKLSQKYELIQRIVSEKERMIAIYEEQIRDSSVRLVESETVFQKQQVLMKENAILAKTVSDLKREILSCEAAIQSLAASEKSLKSQVKNQRHLELEEEVEKIIRAKDSQLQDFIKANERLSNEVNKLYDKVKEYSITKEENHELKNRITHLESTLLERDEEIGELYGERESHKSIKKFTGFMCSPSEKGDSRASPLRVYEGRCKPLPAHSSNPLELKRTIRMLDSEVCSLNEKCEANLDKEKRLQREIQQHMLITAKLEQDMKQLQARLDNSETNNNQAREMILRYQELLATKEDQRQQQVSRLQAELTSNQSELTSKQSELSNREIEMKNRECELRSKEGVLKGDIVRLKEEIDILKERLSIMGEREKESVCIIRAQKRQIQDLRYIEEDIDSQTIEYKKLLNQVSTSNQQIESLQDQLSAKVKELKDLEQVSLIEREELCEKSDGLEKEVQRLKEIKNKLYENGNQLYNKSTEIEDKYKLLQMEEGRSRIQMEKLHNKVEELSKQVEGLKVSNSGCEMEMLDIQKEMRAVTASRNQVELTLDECQLRLQDEREEKEALLQRLTILTQQLEEMVRIQENKIVDIGRLEEVIEKRDKEGLGLKAMIEELSEANKQYSDNENILILKVKELEMGNEELERGLEDIIIKEQDLRHRNIQLDRKNQELADMLNKAIEHQAGEYKHRILSEVAQNATKILENLSEDKPCHSLPLVFNTPSVSNVLLERSPQRTNRTSPNKVNLNPNPKPTPLPASTASDKYSQLLSQRITQNRRKIGESASKLCQLLQFKQLLPQHECEQLSSKMQSLDDQKSSLLSRLSCYSQKLRLL